MIRALTRRLARRHPIDAVTGIIESGTAEPTGSSSLWMDPDLVAAANRAAGIATCRACSCTDEMACPGGCTWADDDLCSTCAPASVQAVGSP